MSWLALLLFAVGLIWALLGHLLIGVVLMAVGALVAAVPYRGRL